MSHGCHECGHEIEDESAPCPQCARSAEQTQRSTLVPGGPGELSAWGRLGWKPGSVMDAVESVPDGIELPAEEDTRVREPPAPLPSSGRLRWLVPALLLALIVAGVVVARTLELRDRDSESDAVLDSAAFRAPDALAELRELLPEAVPPWRSDTTQALTALRASNAAAMRAAEQAHVPLPSKTEHAHDLFSTVLDRGAEDAAWRISLGVHPHPTAWPTMDAENRAAAALLARDMDAWLKAHPATSAPDMHEESDRRMLAAITGNWLSDLDSDEGTLTRIAGITQTLWTLVVIECCAEQDRRIALTGCLRGVPADVRSALNDLRAPNPDRCHSVAAGLRSDAMRLRSVHKTFSGLDSSLAAAARAAATALVAAAKSLEDSAAASRDAERGGSLRRDFSHLALELGSDVSPRDLFDAAIRELRAANNAQIAAVEFLRTRLAITPRASTPTESIAKLRGFAAEWVGELTSDPGVAFQPVVVAGAGWRGLLYSPGPRSRAAASAFVATRPDRTLRGGEAQYAKFEQFHVTAHETYPGHHLQVALSAETCELRRGTASRYTDEGWAMYAEDLLHDTGHCDDSAMDRYVRAEKRAWTALAAALELLYACGHHSVEDLAELVGSEGDESLVNWIGASVVPGASLPYFAGRREIVRLRRAAEQAAGASFNAPAFHRRLLEIGSIPPWLLERELASETERR